MRLEFVNWLQDVGQYLRVVGQRAALRQNKHRADYSAAAYKDLVKRVVEPLHPKRMRLRVVEIIEETPSAKTLRFERVDAPLPVFRAGQYINLFVEIDGVQTSRPFSISSAPEASTLDLTVREKPGGFVSPYLLHGVDPGDVLESGGPAGNFYYEPLIDGRDLVFLAGGSGITPMMSVFRHLLGAAAHGDLRIHLLYGNRSPEDIIFGEALVRLAETYPNFTCSVVISEPPLGQSLLEPVFLPIISAYQFIGALICHMEALFIKNPKINKGTGFCLQ